MNSLGEDASRRNRKGARRKTTVAVILAATVVLAVVAWYVFVGSGSSAPWRVVHRLSGGACDGITTCRTPAFAVTASEWKASWTILAPSDFLVDIYINPNGSYAPVPGGYVRASLSGELRSPVGGGTWVIAFTAPDGSPLSTIEMWTVEIWVR